MRSMVGVGHPETNIEASADKRDAEEVIGGNIGDVKK